MQVISLGMASFEGSIEVPHPERVTSEIVVTNAWIGALFSLIL